jgi:hypothetical protein
MRRATTFVVGLIGLFCASLAGGETAASQAAAQPALRAACATCGIPANLARQERWVFRGGAAFSTRLSAEGTAVMSGHFGDLEFRKEVQPDGGLQLELVRGTEHVTIVAAQGTIEVARNGRSVRLELSAAGEDDLLRLGTLLAGSGAIRSFRLLAAGLQADTEKTPEGVGTLLTDALLGLVSGDPGAMDHVGQRLKQRRGYVRLVALSPGCYEKFETEVIRAWDDYVGCYNEISMWNPMRELCGLRYLIWAESSWFSFLSCSALPINV